MGYSSLGAFLNLVITLGVSVYTSSKMRNMVQMKPPSIFFFFTPTSSCSGSMGGLGLLCLSQPSLSERWCISWTGHQCFHRVSLRQMTIHARTNFYRPINLKSFNSRNCEEKPRQIQRESIFTLNLLMRLQHSPINNHAADEAVFWGKEKKGLTVSGWLQTDDFY